jgi:hypothetical protein
VLTDALGNAFNTGITRATAAAVPEGFGFLGASVWTMPGAATIRLAFASSPSAGTSLTGTFGTRYEGRDSGERLDARYLPAPRTRVRA